MAETNLTTTPYAALEEAGARFVFSRQPSKKPSEDDWLNLWHTAEHVHHWLEVGPECIVGVVPASLGCVVIDIDGGDPKDIFAVLGDPLLVHPSSKPDRFHAWYAHPGGTIPNAKYLVGTATGDIRGDNGYIVLWQPEQVAGMLPKIDDATPVDYDLVTTLPKPPKKGKGADAVRGAATGNRNDTLNTEMFLAAKNGAATVAMEEIRDAALDAGLPVEEVDATVKSAVTAGKSEYRPQFEVSANGLETAFGYIGVEYRLDTRGQSVDVRSAQWQSPDGAAFAKRLDLKIHSPDGWCVANSYTDFALRRELEENCRTFGGKRYKLGPKNFDELFGQLLAFKHDNAGRQVRVDPVRDWLEKLPKWDGENPLLDRMFTDALGASDSALNMATARAFMIGAVKRAFEPGSHHDWLPVLLGDQGVGKSTFCQWLLPAEMRGRWFATGQPLERDRQKHHEQIGSALIVEFSELTAIGIQNVEKVKAWISDRKDRFRAPYAKHAAEFPRGWIGIATANDDPDKVLPPDHTGNRRFVLVFVPRTATTNAACFKRVATYMDGARDALWAEAIHAYRNGEPNTLPGHIEKDRDVMNAQYVQRDGTAELKQLAEDLTAEHANGEPLELATLLDEAGLDMDSISVARRFGGILRGFQWTKSQRTMDGKRATYWTPPATVPRHPLQHVVDAGGASFEFTVSQPSVTLNGHDPVAHIEAGGSVAGCPACVNPPPPKEQAPLDMVDAFEHSMKPH